MLATEVLFPFSHYWWLYLSFTFFILLLLLLDLGIFHRNPHEVTFKEALGWSVGWISLALIFNILLYFFAQANFSSRIDLSVLPGFSSDLAARQIAFEFLSGFIVEKALAADNIFVFVVIFQLFSIPLKYQHKILFYGIIGALIFRAVFIALGATLIQYQPAALLFGIFLIYTGIKLFHARKAPLKPEENRILKFLQTRLPVVSEIGRGQFIVKRNKKIFFTPIFVTLMFIEISDVVFAVDSVPAIFALTKEPLIVFTSNVFAILGLRSMFFMLASIVDKFHLLKYGLALVLIFVGTKMAFLNNLFEGKFPIGISLSIIILIIGGSILGSFIYKKLPD
jgi:tellurite resistance protein TerC